jgi:hypothetical protein
MSTRRVRREVVDFCADNVLVGLILPNGWFGRPYDNVMPLTGCTVAGDRLEVDLAGGDRRLSFQGEGLESAVGDLGLVLRGFSVLTFDWLWYGSDEVKRWVFTGGEVVLTPARGG